MAEFPLDEIQTDAILELQLYRLSKLEIDQIREELAAKKAEAAALEAILKSKTKMWKLITTELEQVAADFADSRRSELGSAEEIVEYDPQAYIVRENTNVVVTKEGWIKRVGQMSSVSKTRVREGDAVLTVVPGSTLDHVVFFCNDGIAYTLPIDQLPVSSGYGEPLAKRSQNEGRSECRRRADDRYSLCAESGGSRRWCRTDTVDRHKSRTGDAPAV